MPQLGRLLALLRRENTIVYAGFTAGMINTIFSVEQEQGSGFSIKIGYQDPENQTADQNQNQNPQNGHTNVDSTLSIIEHPLSTLFVGSISGLFYSIGASFVASMLPLEMMPLVPICLGLSMINSVYKWSTKSFSIRRNEKGEAST
jgi:hypothetical protein